MFRTIRGILPLAAILACSFAGTGCATVATGGGGKQTVTVTSTPQGAAVVVDGQPQGVTPAKVALNRTEAHTIELSAPGYESAHLSVSKHLNPWLLGNVLLGGIIGVVIDVVTDATYTLSPSELNVHLKSKELGPLLGQRQTNSPAVPQLPTH
jgi:hypothetical protein